MGPSLSLLSGCFLFAVVASLFFFFFSSGAGETQTAQRFVVPLVLSRPRSSSSTRSPSSTDTSRHTARTCFFFLFSSSRRWWWGLVCLGGGGPLSLSLSAVRLALHVCLLTRERGGGLPDGAPSYDHNCLFYFMENEQGQCPGRSVLSDKCLSMTGGPYCHANAWWSSPLTKGKMLPVFFICVFCGLVLVLCSFFGKVLFFLGSVCAINFRERTFVFALFLGPCVFGVDLPMVFAYFLAISPRKCFKKFS